MRTMEQQIQAAISMMRSKGQAATDSMSLHNIAAQSMAIKGAEKYDIPQEAPESDDFSPQSLEMSNKTNNVTEFKRVVVDKNLAEQQVILHKAGMLSSEWENPYIRAAIPILRLALDGYGREHSHQGLIMIRAQMVREIQFFQETLLKQQHLHQDVSHLSYLLCTYVDEVFTLYADFSAEISLLVQFHNDSWGGEICFAHLSAYMEKPGKNENILKLYDLVLSLGLKGKFNLIERGDVLLTDLRNQLNMLFYAKNPTQTLSYIDALTGIRKKPRWITPFRTLLFLLLISLIVYGIAMWLLHQKSQAIRQAILAWEPPVLRKVNVTNTIPQLLQDILAEGWLQIREDPQGWLLIFTSDGAFNTGKSELTEEFKAKRNIERLGNALAPWPGDLEVLGHTDNMPFRKSKSGTNQQLSEDRAQVVADKLREGTSINRQYQREILVKGKGESEPIADNRTDEGRRKNRRVDVLWKTKQRDFEEVFNQVDSDIFYK